MDAAHTFSLRAANFIIEKQAANAKHNGNSKYDDSEKMLSHAQRIAANSGSNDGRDSSNRGNQ